MITRMLGKLIGKALGRLLTTLVRNCIRTPYGATAACLWLAIQLTCPWLWTPALPFLGPLWWIVLITGMLTFGWISDHLWRPILEISTDWPNSL